MKFLKDQPIMQLDIPDGNGNVWSSEVAKNAIKKYKESQVKEQRALGELDYTIRVSNAWPMLVVNLTNVSHQITDLKIKNNTLIGDIKILDTPRGKVLQDLIDNKFTTHIAVRADVTVKKNKITKANIVSIDIMSGVQPGNTSLQTLMEKIRKFNIYGEEIKND